MSIAPFASQEKFRVWLGQDHRSATLAPAGVFVQLD
jgi:hypothetical protein